MTDQPSTFDLGQIVVTTALWEGMAKALPEFEALRQIAQHLESHRHGDFGLVGAEDWATNIQAVKAGHQILSEYEMADRRVWVITEGDRSTTTVLLPEDY